MADQDILAVLTSLAPDVAAIVDGDRRFRPAPRSTSS